MSDIEIIKDGDILLDKVSKIFVYVLDVCRIDNTVLVTYMYINKVNEVTTSDLNNNRFTRYGNSKDIYMGHDDFIHVNDVNKMNREIKLKFLNSY